MAIDSLRKRVNMLGFGRRGVLPWPDGTIGAGDHYTLLGLGLAGNDRWKVPFTHDSTYSNNYNGYALVYDHASGTWIPVRYPPIDTEQLVASGTPGTQTSSTNFIFGSGGSLATFTIPSRYHVTNARFRTDLWLEADLSVSGNGLVRAIITGGGISILGRCILVDVGDTRGASNSVATFTATNYMRTMDIVIASSSGSAVYYANTAAPSSGDLSIKIEGYVGNSSDYIKLVAYNISALRPGE